MLSIFLVIIAYQVFLSDWGGAQKEVIVFGWCVRVCMFVSMSPHNSEINRQIYQSIRLDGAARLG